MRRLKQALPTLPSHAALRSNLKINLGRNKYNILDTLVVIQDAPPDVTMFASGFGFIRRLKQALPTLPSHAALCSSFGFDGWDLALKSSRPEPAKRG